jgi:hypothetical protein
MSRVDTASGLGGGQLTENPASPSSEGGSQPEAETPAPNSGTMHEKRDDRENASGKAGPDGKGAGQEG